jgi:glycosyltransferase involved in cell wall biosynthesis
MFRIRVSTTTELRRALSSRPRTKGDVRCILKLQTNPLLQRGTDQPVEAAQCRPPQQVLAAQSGRLFGRRPGPVLRYTRANAICASPDPRCALASAVPLRVPRGPILVHDFFVTEGGADRCAIEFTRLLPSAQVVTSFFDERQFGDRINPARVRRWPLQRLFGPTRHFRTFLPLYPIWFGSLQLNEAPLVLSSSIAFSHAVRTSETALHISYIYTPMRYAWDLDAYLQGSSISLGSRLAARIIRPLLRRWDIRTADRPDVMVAISETVRDRIRKTWGRDSEVIYPPVDTDEIQISTRDDGYLLVAARMLAYRRLDLVVEACRSLDQRLVIVGDGPERQRLEAMAGPATTFLGHVTRPQLLDLIAGASAYVVPGIEDFGIAPVEAMAAGKPVVAFRAGGVAETVVDGETGLFFDQPTAESLAAAIDRLRSTKFQSVVIRKRAEMYDRRLFLEAWRRLFKRLGVDPSL